MSVDAIRNVMEKFQKGYTDRNINEIDAFVEDLFIESDDIVVIGTGLKEWTCSKVALKELLYLDWFYWGDLSMDLNNAYIHHHGPAASFSTKGILNRERVMKTSETALNSDIKSQLKPAIKSGDLERVVRFSASLIEEKGMWKIANMHFSYPDTSELRLI